MHSVVTCGSAAPLLPLLPLVATILLLPHTSACAVVTSAAKTAGSPTARAATTPAPVPPAPARTCLFADPAGPVTGHARKRVRIPTCGIVLAVERIGTQADAAWQAKAGLRGGPRHYDSRGLPMPMPHYPHPLETWTGHWPVAHEQWTSCSHCRGGAAVRPGPCAGAQQHENQRK